MEGTQMQMDDSPAPKAAACVARGMENRCTSGKHTNSNDNNHQQHIKRWDERQSVSCVRHEDRDTATGPHDSARPHRAPLSPRNPNAMALSPSVTNPNQDLLSVAARFHRLQQRPAAPVPDAFDSPAKADTDMMDVHVDHTPSFARANTLLLPLDDRASPLPLPFQRCLSETARGTASPSLNHDDDTLLKARPLLPVEAVEGAAKVISARTFASVLEGRFDSLIDGFVVVDCRYDFEFEGGHVTNAINAWTVLQLEEKFLINQLVPHDAGQRIAIIFHCEFSSQRGPRMLQHLRRQDRSLHLSSYPNLFFPELYLVEGGYKDFFEAFPQHCTGSYLPMLDARFTDRLTECKREDRQARDHRQRHPFQVAHMVATAAASGTTDTAQAQKQQHLQRGRNNSTSKTLSPRSFRATPYGGEKHSKPNRRCRLFSEPALTGSLLDSLAQLKDQQHSHDEPKQHHKQPLRQLSLSHSATL